MNKGPRNLITDVPGVSVGHAQDLGVKTGVTAILFDDHFVASVDIRGGGPGGRETDVLSSENLVGKAHAIVLTGGSVFGLAAADGVCALLSSRNVGLRLVATSPAIPIVPAAVLHDLGNDGNKAWGMDPPYRRLGIEAAEAASANFKLGAAGAGLGARAGLVQGGIGSASADLGDGLMVGAIVAANPVGSVFMEDGQTFLAWPYEQAGEFGGRKPPSDLPPATDAFPNGSRLAAAGRLVPGANTTIAAIAVSADLTNAECKRVAIMAHDGIARAVRPAHTYFDGDTVFVAATGAVDAGTDRHRARTISALGSAASDCLARAIARAVYEADKDRLGA